MSKIVKNLAIWKANLLSIHRANILHNLDDLSGEACKDWKKAADMGYKLAKETLATHCKQTE